MSTSELLRREWMVFRRPGRLIALGAAVLAVVAPGLLLAAAMRSSCDGPCPAVPVAAGGAVVSDQFWFLHRGLGREGSITVRLTSMTGTITYPPPNHDQIVSGLVPWAKAGIIVKDGVRQGSRYAALMMTGRHGVRFQYDYKHDTAGSAGGLSAPLWMRLTREGDTITGAESADGRQWHTVATAKLDGLPETAQAGLFATSPGDLTLREFGLGGSVDEVRFTQAVGVFDHVAVDGGSPGTWQSTPVGEMNHTDWEKYDHASGAVQRDGVVTVSATGDIGPVSDEGMRTVETTLPGLLIGLIIVLVVAARFGGRTAREREARFDGGTARERAARFGGGTAREWAARRVVAARAVVVGAAALVTGLVAVGIVLPAGIAVMKSHGIRTAPLPAPAIARVIAGLAVVLALSAVLAYGLGVWLRRGWAAVLVVLPLIALPYAVTVLPLIPDAVAEWMLRLTPAAGFAVQQTMVAYPQAIAHYAPSAGYFPLPGWAGLLVLGAYTLVVGWLAGRPHSGSERFWRAALTPGRSG